MIPPTLRVALGAVLLVAGLVSYRYPYRVALVSELLDAVGSKTAASSVEPADWSVRFTKYGGLASLVLGGFLLVVYGPLVL